MKYESEKYIITGDMEWEDVGGGLKRKIMGFNDEIMMVYVHFNKGGIGQRHKHIHSQTTYVVSGKFEVAIGEEKKMLSAGDGFFIPPNIEHGAVCMEEGVLIDVFSPIREDFMEGKSYTK
ncbi:MAG: cupin domain-containing protein [Ignavibacteriae bacterium HGW-Ignavibacteriae-2]|jgi:quercetin dioxygenase-like cupin family protein|nr:MAG: cupin domain-containing protein [Ignavibacteriae bacterium HGW-Ignavibacteriae-2]